MAETELSNEVVATTALPEITNLSVTEVSNGFELLWSVNDNNTTGNIAIERSTDNGNTFSRVISGIPRTTETFTDSTNFDTDNPIYRIVRATDDAESVSSEIEYTEPTIPEEVPVAETLESTVTDDGIELTWSSDETDGEFIVYRDTNSGTTGTDYTQIDTVSAFTFNQYLDSGVSSGERYYYRTEYSLIDAVGGNEFDVTIDGVDYRIHEFTSDGTFSVNQISSDKTVDVLVVGGGGSGGSTGGGGGGAGGLVFYENLTISEGTKTITVGAGGQRATGWNDGVGGENGGDSEAFGLLAYGGGHGGDHPSYNKTNGTTPPGSGGSSGGGREDQDQAGSPNPLQPNTNPNATIDAGNIGGAGDGDNGDPQGGGGGAGSAGQSGSSGSDGGNGIDMSQYFGTSFGDNGYFAGGGGGSGGYATSGYSDSDAGRGGVGGGGRGGAETAGDYPEMDAIPNTGGGGGGGGYDGKNDSIDNSGSGGSGIVLIRYEL